MTALDEFEEAVAEVFAAHARELQFSPAPEAYRRYSHSVALAYRGPAAFVAFELDQRDRLFNVHVGPVVGGAVPPRPVFLPRPSEPITWYPLWAILKVHGEPLPPFSFSTRPELDRDLEIWVAAAREHAMALLTGDVSGLSGVRGVLEQNLAEGKAQLKDEVADIVRRARARRERS